MTPAQTARRRAILGAFKTAGVPLTIRMLSLATLINQTTLYNDLADMRMEGLVDRDPLPFADRGGAKNKNGLFVWRLAPIRSHDGTVLLP